MVMYPMKLFRCMGTIIRDDVKAKFGPCESCEVWTRSHVLEPAEYEIIKERLDVMRELSEYIGDYYSREWARKTILRQTDSDIKQQDDQIDKERELGLLPEKNGDGGF